MDWNDLRFFLAAYREGSASKAARTLSVSLSTVSRRLQSLEEQLGRALFARTPDGLSPTAAARAFLPHAEAVERAALSAQSAVQALDEQPEGTVTIAVDGDTLVAVVLPGLPEFSEQFPGITLAWQQSTAVADLSRRHADIAIRTVRPQTGAELVFLRLRTIPVGVYGTQEYLDTVADPRDPNQHRWITWTEDLADLPGSRWLNAVATDATIAMRFNDATAMRHAAAAGLGAVLLPHLFGALTPTLRAISLDQPLPDGELYLVSHLALKRIPAVRAVWDYLRDWLVAHPERDDVAFLRELHERHYGVEDAAVAGRTTPNQSTS